MQRGRVDIRALAIYVRGRNDELVTEVEELEGRREPVRAEVSISQLEF